MLKSLVISSEENSRNEFFRWFDQTLEPTSQHEVERELFFLAVVETVNNAAEHGNLNDPAKKISIQYLALEDSVLVSVADEGVGFSPEFVDIRNVSGERGRGLGLIKANTGLIIFNSAGNRVTLLKGTPVKEGGLKGLPENAFIWRNGIVFITGISADEKGAALKLFEEIIDQMGPSNLSQIFVDLNRIPLAIDEIKSFKALLTTGLYPALVFLNADDAVLENVIRLNEGAEVGGSLAAYSGLEELPELLNFEAGNKRDSS